ncbi:hypothetical protein TNCV_2384261 [Trichonephila clavipes]|nr:hypothetical protein TNCV_2384261 [Trichonephila clavipes]
MIAASPLSPDEYAMRIATQLNLLSSVKSARPHSLSLNSTVFPAPENAFSDGQALKVHTAPGRRANRPPHRAVFWPR